MSVSTKVVLTLCGIGIAFILIDAIRIYCWLREDGRKEERKEECGKEE